MFFFLCISVTESPGRLSVWMSVCGGFGDLLQNRVLLLFLCDDTFFSLFYFVSMIQTHLA